MNFRFALATCTAPFITVTLYGCGGGGGSATTTTTTTTTTATTTTATTTTSTIFTPADADIDGLNKLYMGFTPGSTKSNFGVTIRFVATSHADDGNWYYCHTPCWQGHCDCRVSAAILNNKVMIHEEGSAAHVVSVYGQAGIGVIFNQTTVENQLAKCYYQFDGASDSRYNMGCGCGVSDPDHEDCSSPQSPYQNIDPVTGKQMTDKSKEVADCHCGDGARAGTPTKTTESQCFWKGPAFYPGAAGNEISGMFADRMKNNEGTDIVPGASPPQKRVKKEYWNEVVIDGLLMEQQFKKDPSTVIQAVVWAKTGDPSSDKDARGYANKLAAYFKDTLVLTKNPAVVSMDATVDVTKTGPFSLTTASEEALAV